MLEQVLGCYFHQDYLHEFEDEDSALRGAVESEPADWIAAAASELGVLLALNLTEEALEAVLIDDLGCYFAPDAIGLSCSQWLAHVRQELERGKAA